MDKDLVSFESNFMDEEPENGIVQQVYIDGYPADEDAEGSVVAKVILTEHNDIVVVWQLNAYRMNDIVKEMITEAKERLSKEKKVYTEWY